MDWKIIIINNWCAGSFGGGGTGRRVQSRSHQYNPISKCIIYQCTKTEVKINLRNDYITIAIAQHRTVHSLISIPVWCEFERRVIFLAASRHQLFDLDIIRNLRRLIIPWAHRQQCGRSKGVAVLFTPTPKRKIITFNRILIELKRKKKRQTNADRTSRQHSRRTEQTNRRSMKSICIHSILSCDVSMPQRPLTLCSASIIGAETR